MIERKERPCKTCGEDDKGKFNKQKLGHEGLHARCKKCIKDKYQSNNAKLDRKKKLDSNIVTTKKIKPCTKCGEDDKSKFSKKLSGHEGLGSICKKCVSKYAKKKHYWAKKTNTHKEPTKNNTNLIDPTKKTRPCTKCGEDDKNRFEKNKSGHEGLKSVCMKCRYKRKKANRENKETFVIVDETMSYLQLLLASKKLDPLKINNLKTDVSKEIYAMQNFDKIGLFKNDMFKINENVFWSFKSHQWNFGGKAKMRKKKASLFDLYSSELPKTSNTIGLDSTFWFGRHCGVMVIDVWKKDRQYIDWLVAETEYNFSKSFLSRYDREHKEYVQLVEDRAKLKVEEKEKAKAKAKAKEKEKVAVEELETKPKVVIADPIEEAIGEEPKPIKIDVNVSVDEKKLSFFQWITYWF